MLFARHNRVHDCGWVCVHFMKKSFSQTVSEPEFLLSTYNISTDQSKNDYHLETAGDYVLNTLLVFMVELFVGPQSLELPSLQYNYCILWISNNILRQVSVKLEGTHGS